MTASNTSLPSVVVLAVPENHVSPTGTPLPAQGTSLNLLLTPPFISRDSLAALIDMHTQIEIHHQCGFRQTGLIPSPGVKRHVSMYWECADARMRQLAHMSAGGFEVWLQSRWSVSGQGDALRAGADSHSVYAAIEYSMATSRSEVASPQRSKAASFDTAHEGAL